MVWSWPARFARDLRAPALVMAMDIAPTLLELAGLEPLPEMQGRSLLPILEGRASPERHHPFVRAEYLDALDLPDGTRATMWCDGRYKLSVYHGHALAELYDLEADPGEFDNLWGRPGNAALERELLQASFDATVRAVDLGPPRIGPM
jgi:arylsulfatase A-like enzyme